MGTVPFSGTVPIYGDLSFFAKVLAPALKAVPALATFTLSTLPMDLMTEAFESNFLKTIEKPVLLSELKEKNLRSLRESFPEPLASAPSPLLTNPEALGGNSSPLLSPAPSPSPKRKPLSISPNREKDSKPDFHSPLIWDALKSDRKSHEDKMKRRRRSLNSRKFSK